MTNTTFKERIVEEALDKIFEEMMSFPSFEALPDIVTDKLKIFLINLPEDIINQTIEECLRVRPKDFHMSADPKFYISKREKEDHKISVNYYNQGLKNWQENILKLKE